jgi:hypothetical protein
MSKSSRYFSFCTPECRKTLDEYLDYRRRWGERLNEDSPLFRIDYNIQKSSTARPITSHTIRDVTAMLLLRVGLRKVPVEGKYQRSNIMANHGFRKF